MTLPDYLREVFAAHRPLQAGAMARLTRDAAADADVPDEALARQERGLRAIAERDVTARMYLAWVQGVQAVRAAA